MTMTFARPSIMSRKRDGMKVFHVFAILVSLSFQAAAEKFNEVEAESLAQSNFSGCYSALMKRRSISDEPAVTEHCQCYAESLVARSTPDRNFARLLHSHHPLAREQMTMLKEITGECANKSGLQLRPDGR